MFKAPEHKVETQKQSPNMTEQENVPNGFVNVAPPKVTQFMIFFQYGSASGDGWLHLTMVTAVLF